MHRFQNRQGESLRRHLFQHLAFYNSTKLNKRRCE